MAGIFASGKFSKRLCQQCGFSYPYHTIRRRWDGLFVCEYDYEVRHPQLGPWPQVREAVALREAFPRESAPQLGVTTSTILDYFPGIVAGAYSLRQLYFNYSGMCLNIRRSSDNTTKDFGFAAGIVDTLKVAQFLGVATGFVTTWYDQSGNRRHLTQATAANQPQYVTGIFNPLYTKLPAIRFTGGSISLGTTNFGLTQPLTYFAAVAPNMQLSALPRVVAGTSAICDMFLNGTSVALSAGTELDLSEGAIALAVPFMAGAVISGGTGTIYFNGTLSNIVGTVGASNPNGLQLGNGAGNPGVFDFGEFYAFNAAITTAQMFMLMSSTAQLLNVGMILKDYGF